MRPVFYRRLWRFNAFVVAILGGVAIVTLIAVLSMIVPEILKQSRVGNEFHEQRLDVAAAGELPVLSDQERIAGTSLVTIKVGDERSQDYSGSSSGTGSVDRNVMIVDLKDGSSRYVLPDNRRQLVQWHVFPVSDVASSGKARAYVALVGDGDRKSPAKFDILIGNFATGKQAWVAKGVTAMDSPEILDDRAIALLAWEGSRLSYRRYNLETLAQEVARPIELMGR